ncbi:protein bfr2-like isoform X1 [Carcharodon carcharias]|uniref:protein bfr2-like isoform X1 n=1 Tax=Carcharodon carcharias TaxID=13397 RepID=UPI001B7F3986|nr:protein bfr2-like isoform X1 [Carcharodon carcharias]
MGAAQEVGSFYPPVKVMMKHVKFLLTMQLLSMAVFQVKAIKDIEDYYEKIKRSVDGRIPAGGYYEKVKRNIDDDVDGDEDYDEDDDDEDIDYEDSRNKAKRHVHRARKALDEEREKREYEYYSRGKFARDIDDYVR